MGEWLKPTDCKSVPPSEVRRFESFPVHHVLVSMFCSSRICTGFECGGNYESLGDGVDCVPGVGCAGVYDAERSADPVGDAADSGDVRIEELGAPQGCNPSGWRERFGVNCFDFADVAQLVEHSLGKGEVTSSILVIGSRDWFRVRAWLEPCCKSWEFKSGFSR